MQGKENMQDYTGQELNDSLESTPQNFLQHDKHN